MPPLRTHREDIPLLTGVFLKEMGKEHGKSHRSFSPEAMAALESYEWPGNIRELKAAVEHAVVLGRGEELGVTDLPTAVQSVSPVLHGDALRALGGELNLAQVEEALIRKALAEAAENRTLAAKKLGISRRTLHRHLSQLGISKHIS